MKRRSFIQKTSMGVAGAAVSFPLIASNPTQKIKIGLIGCGWYGMVITTAALKTGDVEVIAACDVDENHLKASISEIEFLQGKKPKAFKNYEDLLEEKELQAVFIGTPPHWHALQFIAACKKGLHIYCEKPLAYDIEEGKAMVAMAEQTGNIVQIGFQRRQSQAFQTVKKLIQDGTTGKIRRIGAQIHYNPGVGDTNIQEPPAGLDWDAWCGPAPKLPYRPSIAHKKWRLEKEYGNGHLVDWGIHHIDIIRTIMDFGMPQRLETEGGLDALEGKITTPDTLEATMLFDDCPLIWQHRLWGTGDLHPDYNNGVFFYGDKATVFASDNRLVISKKGEQQKQLDIQTPDAQYRHVANFVEAVKERNMGLLTCRIQDAFQSTASVQLAMISYYTGTDVNWDADKRTILKNKQASDLMDRSYRGNFKRPKIG